MFGKFVLSVDGKNDYPEQLLKGYLEGQGDLVSRSIMGIIRVTIWVIWVINPLTKSP